MAFKVEIANDSVKRFDTAKAALQYAEGRVYLKWERHDEALQTIEAGKTFSYTYGFNEAQISPA